VDEIEQNFNASARVGVEAVLQEIGKISKAIIGEVGEIRITDDVQGSVSHLREGSCC